jgi:hypothetical protein
MIEMEITKNLINGLDCSNNDGGYEKVDGYVGIKPTEAPSTVHGRLESSQFQETGG